MINIVSQYNNYVNSLPELISNTHFKAEYFIEQLGVSSATYYRKLRENTFSVNEITKITTLLFPKEVYKQEILESLEKGRSEVESGTTISLKDFKKQMRKQIESYQ